MIDNWDWYQESQTFLILKIRTLVYCRTTQTWVIKQSLWAVFTWIKTSEFRLSWILRGFCSSAWIILRKSKIVWFPAIKNFSAVLWHSNWHRSKALIMRKNIYCHDSSVVSLVLVKEDMKRPLSVFKKAFLGINFESKIPAVFKVFNSPRKSRFRNFTKNIENNPHNVYIFWMGDARAFQNRFNHVHTTSLDISRGSQLGINI